MEVKNAMNSLRWVAYEEYTYDCDVTDDEQIKKNDLTDSSETDEKTDDGVSELSSEEHDDSSSESAESEEEGLKRQFNKSEHCQNISFPISFHER